MIGGSISYPAAASLLTTRGDLIRRGLSVPERVALGAAGTVLSSDGSDAVWSAASGSWTTVTKLANETVISSVALQNDDHLFAALTLDKAYLVELLLIYSSSTAGAATPDLKIDLGEDGTARGVFQAIGFDAADAAFHSVLLANQAAIAVAGTAVAVRALLVRGTYVSAGGTFRLRWAQNTSSIAPTQVRAGSVLRYLQIN